MTNALHVIAAAAELPGPGRLVRSWLRAAELARTQAQAETAMAMLGARVATRRSAQPSHLAEPLLHRPATGAA